MRTSAEAWNNASKYGPYCELFFFFVKNERAKGEEFIGTPFGLCDHVRTIDQSSACRSALHETFPSQD